MSWDDVVIGTGNKGNSAVKVFAIEGEHRIAQNATSYWISDAYLEGGMTIFKDTKEGQFMTKMIEDKVEAQVIFDWCATQFIKNCAPHLLKEKVDNTIERAFERGMYTKQVEICSALGLSSRYQS